MWQDAFQIITSLQFRFCKGKRYPFQEIKMSLDHWKTINILYYVYIIEICELLFAINKYISVLLFLDSVVSNDNIRMQNKI